MVKIEVVYALTHKQELQTLEVKEGTCVREAVLNSNIGECFPDLDLATVPLGIFGKLVKDDTLVRERDRIEIYRPLLIDPKEARRLRVKNLEEE